MVPKGRLIAERMPSGTVCNLTFYAFSLANKLLDLTRLAFWEVTTWQLNWGMAALGGLLGALIAWSASPVVATILPLLFAFIGGAGGLSLLKMDLSKPANILKLQTTGNAFIYCCSACLLFLLLALFAKPLLDNLESTPSSRHPIDGKNFTSDDYINQIALRRRLDLVKASDKEITAVLSAFTNVDSEALLNSLTQTAKDFRTEVEKLSDADCVSACNFDPLMEWAPRAGQGQAADLTVCRVF
jgi:hypothetical protein